MQRQRGLTLLELLVVLAIISIAMTGVSLSMRDNHQTQLEREAQRLVAVLEAARAQSRTRGVALIWQTTPEGFVIWPSPTSSQAPIRTAANPMATRTESWLSAGTQAMIHTSATPTNNAPPANAVVLGPEPILAPAHITLSRPQANSSATSPTLRIGTDGLQPFRVLP